MLKSSWLLRAHLLASDGKWRSFSMFFARLSWRGIHLKTNVFVKTKGFDFKVDRFLDNPSFKCCFLSESFWKLFRAVEGCWGLLSSVPGHVPDVAFLLVALVVVSGGDICFSDYFRCCECCAVNWLHVWPVAAVQRFWELLERLKSDLLRALYNNKTQSRDTICLPNLFCTQTFWIWIKQCSSRRGALTGFGESCLI